MKNGRRCLWEKATPCRRIEVSSGGEDDCGTQKVSGRDTNALVRCPLGGVGWGNRVRGESPCGVFDRKDSRFAKAGGTGSLGSLESWWWYYS